MNKFNIGDKVWCYLDSIKSEITVRKIALSIPSNRIIINSKVFEDECWVEPTCSYVNTVHVTSLCPQPPKMKPEQFIAGVISFLNDLGYKVSER